MSQRAEPPGSLDFFPTPLWGTRALCHYILGDRRRLKHKTVWNPACGQGHMARALGEYFGHVYASDIFPYGYGELGDFLETPLLGGYRPPEKPDWIIENPPFAKADDFVRQAMTEARSGVAMLCRTVWGLETRPRERLFREFPMSYCAPFMCRLPMVKGRISKKAKSATAYAWFVWDFENPGRVGEEKIVRIPYVARHLLDRPEDWNEYPLKVAA